MDEGELDFLAIDDDFRDDELEGENEENPEESLIFSDNETLLFNAKSSDIRSIQEKQLNFESSQSRGNSALDKLLNENKKLKEEKERIEQKLKDQMLIFNKYKKGVESMVSKNSVNIKTKFMAYEFIKYKYNQSNLLIKKLLGNETKNYNDVKIKQKLKHEDFIRKCKNDHEIKLKQLDEMYLEKQQEIKTNGISNFKSELFL